jgi:uncharacterized protein (TIGR02246 family)
MAMARDAIRDLAAAYAHAADRGRFDDLAALFAPQGVLELDDGRRMTGREAIVAFLRDTADTALPDAPRPRLVRHHVASHRIVVEGPHAAHGWAYFVVFTERGPDHWGRYRDAYVHTAHEWRFASRHVRVDGRASGAPSGVR